MNPAPSAAAPGSPGNDSEFRGDAASATAAAAVTRPPGRPKGSKDKRPRKRKDLAGALGVGNGLDTVAWVGQDLHGDTGGVLVSGPCAGGYLECGVRGDIADHSGGVGGSWAGCSLGP